MIILRAHLAKVLEWRTEDIMAAEERGLEYLAHGKGTTRMYRLVDVTNFLHRDGKLKLSILVGLIRLASQDARNQQPGGNFDVATALEMLEKGEMPAFPDATTAQKVSTAHKNFMDAKTKEQDRRLKAAELVDKSIVMTQVNRVANVYEDKMGENLFRKFERLAPRATAALEDGTFYEFVRETMAQELDDCIDEVNRIEEGLQETL